MIKSQSSIQMNQQNQEQQAMMSDVLSKISAAESKIIFIEQETSNKN